MRDMHKLQPHGSIDTCMQTLLGCSLDWASSTKYNKGQPCLDGTSGQASVLQPPLAGSWFIEAVFCIVRNHDRSF